MTRQGFGGVLTDDQWTRLTKAGTRRRHEAGSQIMRQGEPGDSVHLLVAGRVKVSMVRPDGQEVLLVVRSYGEALGEMAAITGRPRSATVTAIGTCYTHVVLRDRFRQLVNQMGLDAALLEHFVVRQVESDATRAEQTALPAERRLAKILVQLAAFGGENIAPDVTANGRRSRQGVLFGLSQQDIADHIGASRSSVAQAFIRFRELGIVRTGRQFVAVHDLDRLRAIAHGGSDA
ncbi:Crp/Fnr family transcriptional regulator [Marinitenerispora sediminis]|uniref:Crp/Fnr family transcriptional regulator n=1 Tax=Marinitenerispora sediminis TaxID=1931232 RepID=A0A368TBI7_9ACTN|nr:Crp/Fnr family transcriptional regulator [Marinitenerispora sediminis]RCV58153.1 hypothetical protein DEF28_00330 [Marinitenerispora sediminis]RCV61444.1 hypothetical protein DEF23_02145 [Marinitenerispora sediminis]RCV62524.1 hypothetical protein DEF24_00680 [Marinitenerispora sediminis]